MSAVQMLYKLSPSVILIRNKVFMQIYVDTICKLRLFSCRCKPVDEPFVSLAVTMVMGIPTVKRKVKSYLSETLRSLIDKLTPEEKLDCVIIVFVGEVRSQ